VHHRLFDVQHLVAAAAALAIIFLMDVRERRAAMSPMPGLLAGDSVLVPIER
jgi:hypothetical protein